MPQRATSSDQPSVTVVDLSDPALAGQGIELVNLDALHLTSGVPFRARRVVVRLESSTVVYHSTNHRIRTRTKAQRGQLAYVIFGPQARSTENGVLMRPELILAVEPETEVVFVTEAGHENITLLLPPADLRAHLRDRRRESEFPSPKGAAEISKAIATSFQQVTDPDDQQIRQVSSVSSGNEDLKAEKSESAVIGFVIEPTTNASFSMNYYWIDWTDRILRPSSQEVLNASCPQGGPGCPSIPGVVIRDPSNANQVVTVFRSYQNRANVKTTGVDFDARVRIPTDKYGRYVVRVNGTYLDRFEEDGVDHAGANSRSYTQPRWRALAALDRDYGPWAATARPQLHPLLSAGAAAGELPPGA